MVYTSSKTYSNNLSEETKQNILNKVYSYDVLVVFIYFKSIDYI